MTITGIRFVGIEFEEGSSVYEISYANALSQLVVVYRNSLTPTNALSNKEAALLLHFHNNRGRELEEVRKLG